MTQLRFDDRVVVVTGAGRGIGRAHARLLASRGAAVVVCDVGGDADGNNASPGPAAEVVKEIQDAGGRAVASTESVATEAGASAIVEAAVTAFGRLDAVINNAGIFNIFDFDKLTEDIYRAYLDVHFLGSVFVSRAAWPHLIESGSGRVINTISGAMLGVPSMVHYGSAKGAVFGLTRNLAVEGAPHGIKVNAIAPGAGTRMVDRTGDALPPGTAEFMKANMPPELVAPVAAYLAHENCEITGEVLNAGAGSVSRMVPVNTAGINDPELTPEVIAARLDEILDVTSSAPAGLMFREATAR